MILGAEIAMLIMGLIALVKGKMTLSKKRVLLGTPARVMGVVAMLPIPISLCLAFLAAIVLAATDSTMTEDSFRGYAIAIELGVLILTLVAVYGVGGQYAVDPEEEQRKVEAWDASPFDAYRSRQGSGQLRDGIQDTSDDRPRHNDDRIRD